MQRSVPALAVLTGGVAAAVPLTSAGARSSGPRTVRLVEHDKDSTLEFVDSPPRITNRRRPVVSSGETTVFSTPVFDADNRNRTPMGRLRVQCVASWGGGERHADALCTGVYGLTHGQMSLTAVLPRTLKVVHGIVTGGDPAGAYAGARGRSAPRTLAAAPTTPSPCSAEPSFGPQCNGRR